MSAKICLLALCVFLIAPSLPSRKTYNVGIAWAFEVHYGKSLQTQDISKTITGKTKCWCRRNCFLKSTCAGVSISKDIDNTGSEGVTCHFAYNSADDLTIDNGFNTYIRNISLTNGDNGNTSTSSVSQVTSGDETTTVAVTSTTPQPSCSPRTPGVGWSAMKTGVCVGGTKLKQVMDAKELEPCKKICEEETGCKSISYDVGKEICRLSILGSDSSEYKACNGYEWVELQAITCDGDWTAVGDDCLKVEEGLLSADAKSRSAAADHCKTIGGRIATPSSLEDWYTHFSSSGISWADFWIAGTRSSDTTGSNKGHELRPGCPVPDDWWETLEPSSDASTFCLAGYVGLRSFRLKLRLCDTPYGFVCQKVT